LGKKFIEKSALAISNSSDKIKPLTDIYHSFERKPRMKTKKFISYLLLAILAGCGPVLSLHPLFTEKDLVFEEKLLGRWAHYEDPNKPPVIWHFKQADKSEKKYQLTLRKEDKMLGHFTAHLLKLDDILFMDVFPDKLPSGKTLDKADPNQLIYNFYFLLPLHTFVKIEFIKPLSYFRNKSDEEFQNKPKQMYEQYDYGMKLRLTDDEKLKELLEEKPDVVKYEKLEKDKIILTASTHQLQEFVLKHADGDKLFTDGVPLLRFRNKKAIQSPEEKKAIYSIPYGKKKNKND